MNSFDSHVSTHYDSKFSFPPLTWLPWVGLQYASQPDGKRLLIVGESHYYDEKEFPGSKKAVMNPIETRWIAKKMGMDSETNGTRFFQSVNAVLDGLGPITKKALWEKSAFYNFIQRPMNTNKERPSDDDYKVALSAFRHILYVLKPDACLFFGVEAAKKMYHLPDAKPLNLLRFKSKVDNAYPWEGHLTLPVKKVNLLFIKHGSSYFSPLLWKPFISKWLENSTKDN